MQASLRDPLHGGWFPLIAAVDAGDGEAVATLLEAGDDANQAVVAPSEHPAIAYWEWIGSTALSLAARKGDRPIAEMLLGHEGTEVDKALGDGTTPVSLAAEYGHHEIVGMLADMGADLDLTDENGFTPVYVAAQNGHPEVVRVLADNGANLDLAMEGGTTVFIAAQNGHLEVVRILHQYKARLHEPANNGTTALHGAAYNGHLDVVRYLARHGADIARLSENGRSALDAAQDGGRTSVFSLLEAVESAGSWRKYIALQRMAYILIRHEVSATYKVLPKTKSLRKLRALLHFVFGRNRDTVDDVEEGDVLDEAFDACFEKPKAMQVLPDDVFALVCRFLKT